jgi:hypothetical protein
LNSNLWSWLYPFFIRIFRFSSKFINHLINIFCCYCFLKNNFKVQWCFITLRRRVIKIPFERIIFLLSFFPHFFHSQRELCFDLRFFHGLFSIEERSLSMDIRAIIYHSYLTHYKSVQFYKQNRIYLYQKNSKTNNKKNLSFAINKIMKNN